MLVSIIVFAFVLLACVLLKLDLVKPDFLPYVALIIAYAVLLGVWIAPENRELLEWRKKKRLESKTPRSEDGKKQEKVHVVKYSSLGSGPMLAKGFSHSFSPSTFTLAASEAVIPPSPSGPRNPGVAEL